MPKTWFTRETFNPRRLARDQHSTSSHANIQAMQFYKTLAIYYCIEDIENTRAGEEFKSLILASTAWYEIFAGFMYTDFLQWLCHELIVSQLSLQLVSARL